MKAIGLVACCVLCGALGGYAASTSRAQAQGVGPDVAVESGEIITGQEIPLPHYQDGSQAAEADCRWIVGVSEALGPQTSGFIKRITCKTSGRTATVFTCQTSNCGESVDPQAARAAYFIVAVRGQGVATAVHRATLGQLKQQFREGR